MTTVSSSVKIGQKLRRLRVLLVDPDPQACERVRQALGDGFVLREVHTFSEARSSLAEALPDVLICEVFLNAESGLDLCRYVRRIPSLRHLPIMLLTTLTTLKDKIAGFDAGADDYFVKPFDARHLAARIRLLSRIKSIEQGEDQPHPGK
jgi:DNA-binding response OmpR family regulator